MRSMEPAMVLEVPNKSSNILNTFGLSKSHRRSRLSSLAASQFSAVLLGSLSLRARGTRAAVLK